jgi:hypothetical protein
MLSNTSVVVLCEYFFLWFNISFVAQPSALPNHRLASHVKLVLRQRLSQESRLTGMFATRTGRVPAGCSCFSMGELSSKPPVAHI